MRFDYGATVPWVTRAEDGTIDSIAGPERLVLRTPGNLHGEDLKTVGEFMVGAGQSVPFVLSHGPSFESPPAPIDPFKALERTEAPRTLREFSSELEVDERTRESLVRGPPDHAGRHTPSMFPTLLYSVFGILQRAAVRPFSEKQWCASPKYSGRRPKVRSS